MIEIVHKTVRMADPVIPPDHRSYRREKPRPIGRVREDVRAGIAPRGQVIDGAWVRDPQRPGHDHHLPHRMTKIQDTRPEPQDRTPVFVTLVNNVPNVP